MIRTLLLCFAVASFALAADHPTTKPIGGDRANNGGFERGAEGWPFAAMNGCQATGDVVSDQSHSGSKSFKITNKSKFAPNVYARIYQNVNGLEPFTTYRISCYVKGKNSGICWIGGGPGWFQREHFPKGTFDWTYVETTMTTGGDSSDFELMVCTESPTVALWVDDIKFEPIKADVAKRDAAMAKFGELVIAQQKHFDAVKEKIARANGAELEPQIAVGMYVAQRYLDRILSYPPVQSSGWSTMQLEEIDDVLKQTEQEVELFKSQGRKPRPIDFPTGGPVTIRDGVFYTDTSAGKNKPWFFYGMGHFDQVIKDLPNWHKMGATMIQDGRNGPNSIEKDGTLRDGAKHLLVDLSRADLYGVKTDYLLSPHYFPDWAWPPQGTPQRKDLEENGGPGFLYFNIDSPFAKDAIGRWADIITKKMQDHPALFSICLSNEPVYGHSGQTKETLPLYREYLKDVHHDDIAALNQLYGTHYKSFDEIVPTSMGLSNDVAKNCAYYDWQRFNKKHFADWHTWMRDICKKNLPDIPIHAKPMIFLSMDRDKLSYGVDGEQFCAFSDIAGCDAYAFPAGDHKTYDWIGEEFWYDLLNSFRNQPVFNSENHLIPDGSAPFHLPSTMTRAQYWQGALHHQGVTTTWVWEEDIAPGLSGSIFFRPANAYGAARAFVDLGHFAEEAAAINQAPADVALLYSQPSIFWEDKYLGTNFHIYTQLNFLGRKATFVSEAMLQSGRVPKVKWIVLPQATHVEDATVVALQKFQSDGGKIIHIGDECLKYDQYHRPRKVDSPAIGVPLVFAKDQRDTQQSLFELFKQAGDAPVELVDSSDGKRTWDVEFRVVDHNGATLIPMIDFANDAQTVKLPSLAGKRLVDLLSGESTPADHVKLEPMVPRLFKVQ